MSLTSFSIPVILVSICNAILNTCLYCKISVGNISPPFMIKLLGGKQASHIKFNDEIDEDNNDISHDDFERCDKFSIGRGNCLDPDECK